ncbi:InlB B-repeat-containing protein [Erysipelothrix tonsillarum]|uniref:InlB B-repeat-containing protein n=1 Tax=Erysipelothrix tonsillarum TaxID=38402 RepID=UPI00036095C1|nr:InlB B-repeat-containing protein [Erysipelothrix tonsillarum]
MKKNIKKIFSVSTLIIVMIGTSNIVFADEIIHTSLNSEDIIEPVIDISTSKIKEQDSIPFPNATITASKNSLKSNDTVEYSLKNFEINSNTYGENVSIEVLTERYDSSTEIQSLQIPKIVFTIDGKKFGAHYQIWSKYGRYQDIEEQIPLDSEFDSFTVSRKDLLMMLNGDCNLNQWPWTYNILVRPVDENGNILYSENFDMVESFGDFRFNYKTNVIGKNFNDRGYPLFQLQLLATKMEGQTPIFPSISTSLVPNYTPRFMSSKLEVSSSTMAELTDGDLVDLSFSVHNNGPFSNTSMIVFYDNDNFEPLESDWIKKNDGYYLSLTEIDNPKKYKILTSDETLTFTKSFRFHNNNDSNFLQFSIFTKNGLENLELSNPVQFSIKKKTKKLNLHSNLEDIENISLDIEENTIYTLPILKHKNYYFEGWYSDEQLKNKVSLDLLIDKDINLYARWSIIEDSIDDTGTIINPNSPQNEQSNKPTEPEYTGDSVNLGNSTNLLDAEKDKKEASVLSLTTKNNKSREILPKTGIGKKNMKFYLLFIFYGHLALY